jgi:hypothetical protein
MRRSWNRLRHACLQRGVGGVLRACSEEPATADAQPHACGSGEGEAGERAPGREGMRREVAGEDLRAGGGRSNPREGGDRSNRREGGDRNSPREERGDRLVGSRMESRA